MLHDPEPPLDANQSVALGFPFISKQNMAVEMSTNSFDCRVQELENKLESGLLEEVILVAEGELKLVNTMLESRV